VVSAGIDWISVTFDFLDLEDYLENVKSGLWHLKALTSRLGMEVHLQNVCVTLEFQIQRIIVAFMVS